MLLKKILCSAFIFSVIFASCLLNAAWAVDSSPMPKPTMMDVALSDGGTLEGQVVNIQNGGMQGVPVSIRSQDREMVQTTTTANGQFVVRDLRGGVYQVATAQGDSTFRLWAPRTAPPAAQNRAIVYVQNGGGGGGLRAILGNPLVLPAIIATAVAVPIAVSASHQPASP
jgi:hypothetical protein